MSTIQLHLGDCLNFMRGLADKNLDAVITDPPYNIGFKYSTYKDKLSPQKYIAMLSAFRGMPGAMVAYPEEMFRYLHPALGDPGHVSAWCYNSNIPRRFRLVGYWGGLRPDYKRIRQPYKNPKDKRIRQRIEAGSDGSPLYEWWNDIQIVKNVSKEKTQHPCPVPVELMKRIILLCTDPGATVFDPFMGSGTTGVACVQTGRNFIGCEIDPEYFAIAEKRVAEAQMQSRMPI